MSSSSSLLLETPDTGTRGQIRRRTTVKSDAGIGDALYDSSSSSRTNSSDDSLDNNEDQQITAHADNDININTNEEKSKENIIADDNKAETTTTSRMSVLQYAYRPSSPAHRRIKESPLSSDAIFNQSHAGLFNLCIVVLVAVNGRLIIENLMKYGLLINSNFWFSSRSLRDWPLLMCCISLLAFPLTAYVVEKLAWKKRISDSVVITLHVIITTTAILYPVFMILRFESVVLSGVSLMLFACINWLKLVSFVHTNYDMRSLVNSIDKCLKMSINDSANLEKISIENKYGEKLVGLLHETGSKEIVIVCHGFLGKKESSMMMELCIALEKQGISAFRFDFSGNGESEGPFQFGNYRKEVDDLRAVIEHFTIANRVVSAAIGHSKGGNVIILYASLYLDIKTIVNVSGRYNMSRGIENLLGEDYLERAKKDGFVNFKFKTGEKFLSATEEGIMECLSTNMHEAGLKVNRECRVLTVYGSDDEITSVEDALEFAKIIPNHKLEIIEGANHFYTNHIDELVHVVLGFLKDNMLTT